VDQHGENAISVLPGANALLTPADIEAAAGRIISARVLLLQLEIPLPTIHAAIACARAAGVSIILDPAPVPKQMDPTLWSVDLLCGNSHEISHISGCPVMTSNEAKRVAQQLCSQGLKQVVITLGADGAVWCDGNAVGHVPGFAVEAQDTTAAGDAFHGALGWQLALGRSLPQAVRYACAAGAYAATILGAQLSLPTADQVETLLHISTVSVGSNL
jgi:ribokinase